MFPTRISPSDNFHLVLYNVRRGLSCDDQQFNESKNQYFWGKLTIYIPHMLGPQMVKQLYPNLLHCCGQQSEVNSIPQIEMSELYT